MLRREQMDAVRSVLTELAQAQTLAALCLSRLEEFLATDVGIDPETSDLPRTDESKFCIFWRGRTCHLGPTKSFRLFVRLLRRADHYVSYDHLCRDVWEGDVKSPDTVRSAVRELKKKLCQAKMKPLARAIKGHGHHYGLILQCI